MNQVTVENGFADRRVPSARDGHFLDDVARCHDRGLSRA